jgi:uncharacterized protein YfaS (alpha-2-macroglobulin family)
VSELPLSLDRPVTIVKVPITEDFYPSVNLQAYLAHDNKQCAEGELKLSVPPLKRTLAVSADTRGSIAVPGKEIAIDVSVKDSSGKPVSGCRVALAVVDEAVLATANYKWPDPVSAFYPEISSTVFSSHSRSGPVALLFTDINMAVVAPKLGEERSFPQPNPEPICNIAMPKGFSALALFRPIVDTDADGKARVVFKLPDYATKYRIMAVAVSQDNRFGASESSLTAK